jgi:hypothetical protein
VFPGLFWLCEPLADFAPASLFSFTVVEPLELARGIKFPLASRLINVVRLAALGLFAALVALEPASLVFVEPLPAAVLSLRVVLLVFALPAALGSSAALLDDALPPLGAVFAPASLMFPVLDCADAKPTDRTKSEAAVPLIKIFNVFMILLFEEVLIDKI